MAKGNKNNKPAEAALVDLAAELGIPSDVAPEAIELALQQDDPQLYLRNFAADAETMAAADQSETPGIDPAELAQAEVAKSQILETSITGIPLATQIAGRAIDENWPPRIGHIQVQMGHLEGHMKDALVRLHHGLQETNARLRGRTPDEPPRPIVSQSDSIKWLLENMSLQS